MKFTEEFLKNIAAITSTVKLTQEHTRKPVGELENFIYSNGSLLVHTPQDVDLKGQGISPVFEMNLLDQGEYYLAVDGVLKEAGLTKTPRNHILYNNITTTLKPTEGAGEDDKMGEYDEVLKKALERDQAQQEEIGQLKAQLSSTTQSLKDKQDLEDKIKTLEKEAKDAKKEMEALKTKADAHDNYEKGKKEALITELVGDDEKLKKELETLPYEKLKTLKESKIITQKPKGVGTQGAPGLDDGTQKGGNNHPPTGDEFKAWRKKQNAW